MIGEKVMSDIFEIETVKTTMLAAIWATNKQALVNHIRATVSPEFLAQHPDAPLLQITLVSADCRCHASYLTEDDIPEHSVSCPCGNPTHWLIKYGEDKNG